MKFLVLIGLSAILGLTACQKRDTDTIEQDKTTTPHSMDQDKT